MGELLRSSRSLAALVALAFARGRVAVSARSVPSMWPAWLPTAPREDPWHLGPQDWSQRTNRVDGINHE